MEAVCAIQLSVQCTYCITAATYTTAVFCMHLTCLNVYTMIFCTILMISFVNW